ncbi:alpha/beta hydrolase fold protein [Pseudopedobacter saltans DSM 12145]|uniref:Alpha/beta hydrolase fold protein n=1 Tax=Pseudopedobacter saltans (strain ATCC 51119 / DSM 12145 / JCM 21818 / CCUG 39354 / LMG 10337 / NBRC 100064 / NCIMB 13643) TaxID=762903 RepID=F0SAP3_PSESL|nr:alpha/beta fold hydrolase [Pseudopedobacter saltans]ADY53664.1 alpha/beta hydrolase fold protein [Pseudopedobacter saltans DSM 12145]
MDFKIAGFNNKSILGDITFSDSGSKVFALFVHGFKGFKDWGAHNLVAKYFADHGIDYVKFNFSHSGVPVDDPKDVTNLEDFANNTPVKELFDLEKVISYLKQEHEDSKIILIGHSRGGGISILQAERDKRVNALITWAAINDFSSLWKKEQEDEWKATGKIETFNARTKEYMPLNLILLQDYEENKESLDIKKAAEKLQKPWLIIHGDEDINVSLSVAEEFRWLNPKAKFELIKNANHVFGASHPYHGTILPDYLLTVCKESVRFIMSLSFLK